MRTPTSCMQNSNVRTMRKQGLGDGSQGRVLWNNRAHPSTVLSSKGPWELLPRATPQTVQLTLGVNTHPSKDKIKKYKCEELW